MLYQYLFSAVYFRHNLSISQSAVTFRLGKVYVDVNLMQWHVIHFYAFTPISDRVLAVAEFMSSCWLGHVTGALTTVATL